MLFPPGYQRPDLNAVLDGWMVSNPSASKERRADARRSKQSPSLRTGHTRNPKLTRPIGTQEKKHRAERVRRVWQHSHLVNVRFAPKATEVLRCRELTRCARTGNNSALDRPRVMCVDGSQSKGRPAWHSRVGWRLQRHPRSGPTVLLVVSYALGQGWRTALPTAVGVALGDFTAMTLSMLGVGALLATSAILFTTLK